MTKRVTKSLTLTYEIQPMQTISKKPNDVLDFYTLAYNGSDWSLCDNLSSISINTKSLSDRTAFLK